MYVVREVDGCWQHRQASYTLVVAQPSLAADGWGVEIRMLQVWCECQSCELIKGHLPLCFMLH